MRAAGSRIANNLSTGVMERMVGKRSLTSERSEVAVLVQSGTVCK